MAGHSATMMAAELGPLELALVRDAGPKLWPRIAATSIASLALAIHFAAVAIIGAFLVSQLVTLRTFDAVREGLQRELAWFDLPLFAGKSLGLGMIVGWFGCHFAIEARSSPSEIARASSRAFVSSLMAGAVYSIGLTIVLYAIIGAPQPP
jgi:ABC-type transporter Mla maintaining outer membrane lipid asymmetry permease subunit MlaE